MSAPPFQAFPKIQRLANLDMIITEKIDGTNGAVVVTEDGVVYAQSRNRYVTPDDDNYGFAAWVERNADALADTLGVGTHFGEWWGVGIQRGYGESRRRFSLFNTHRWGDAGWEGLSGAVDGLAVVPVLDAGTFSPLKVRDALHGLLEMGSLAAPGFMRPEGVMVYVPRLNTYVKHLPDATPKGPKTNGHDVLVSV